MSSLFHLFRNKDPELVKLPSECVLDEEADTLRAKREAKLKWMRERGIRYLGNPMVSPDRRAPGSPIAPTRNVRIEVIERPGDEIVRDLASNG